jgi:heptosyltransferase-2
LNNKTKILIVAPSWVGDMVMAQSLFIQLKQQQPDCIIDVLAPEWTFSLLERMPQVRRAIAMPLTHGQFGFWARRRLGKQLRAEHYELAFVLPNSWKSALVPFFAGITRRIGYLGEMRWGLLNEPRKLDKHILSMTVQRFVALALPASTEPPVYPLPALHINKAQQQAVAAKFAVKLAPNIIALCAGAEYGAAKRWPVAYFAEIADFKIAQGCQVWLFGSEKDKAITEAINRETHWRCRDFAGQTTIAEAVDLLSLVDTVVCNDSGLMHIAAALDKKVIALYGSSDPTFTPPLNHKARVISLNLPCAPCFKRVCPLEHTRCLHDMTPQQVIEAML